MRRRERLRRRWHQRARAGRGGAGPPSRGSRRPRRAAAARALGAVAGRPARARIGLAGAAVDDAPQRGAARGHRRSTALPLRPSRRGRRRVRHRPRRAARRPSSPGTPRRRWRSADVRTAAPPRVAFVFSGQGPQWARMGRELAAREPVFREVLADLDARFEKLGGWSLSPRSPSRRTRHGSRTRRSRSPPSSPSRSRWPRCGAPGASVPTRSSATASASSRRSTSPGCCRSTTPSAWCGTAAGSCSAPLASAAWLPPG